MPSLSALSSRLPIIPPATMCFCEIHMSDFIGMARACSFHGREIFNLTCISCLGYLSLLSVWTHFAASISRSIADQLSTLLPSSYLLGLLICDRTSKTFPNLKNICIYAFGTHFNSNIILYNLTSNICNSQKNCSVHQALEYITNERDSLPKTERFVFNYSPLCHSNPIRISFIFANSTNEDIFNETQEISVLPLEVHYKTFLALQNFHKDFVKVI